jgi:hypothetical protein
MVMQSDGIEVVYPDAKSTSCRATPKVVMASVFYDETKIVLGSESHCFLYFLYTGDISGVGRDIALRA